MAVGDTLTFYPSREADYYPRILRATEIPDAELFNAAFPGNGEKPTTYAFITEDEDLIIGYLVDDADTTIERLADQGINIDPENIVCDE